MDKGRGTDARGAPKRLVLLFSPGLAVRGHGLDVDRIGRGKGVLEPLFERALEPALARLLATTLGLVVGLPFGGVFRICHACLFLQAAHAGPLRINNAAAVACVPGPGASTR